VACVPPLRRKRREKAQRRANTTNSAEGCGSIFIFLRRRSRERRALLAVDKLAGEVSGEPPSRGAVRGGSAEKHRPSRRGIGSKGRVSGGIGRERREL